MAFEYNGVVYRDLEPQVRYDAEQVQLLKQADVTINENLQTINNEVNGKLTKPTNPSAESAVTMLADGTVGTKLLSEIGGGGKLYLHKVMIFDTIDTYTAELYFLLSKSDNIINNLGDYNSNFIRGLYHLDTDKNYPITNYIVTDNIMIFYTDTDNSVKYISKPFSEIKGDWATEL